RKRRPAARGGRHVAALGAGAARHGRPGAGSGSHGQPCGALSEISLQLGAVGRARARRARCAAPVRRCAGPAALRRAGRHRAACRRRRESAACAQRSHRNRSAGGTMRIHPWLLAVLGLTAFGLLVWFAGPLASIGNSTPLASDDARIALIAAFALQYLVHKGWSAWSARRRNERVVDQLAPAASGAEPAELAQLRKRFSAALATLRRTRFGSQRGQGGRESRSEEHTYELQSPDHLVRRR